MAKVKYLSVKHPEAIKLHDCPSFSATGSIKGMKDKFYGRDALLVRSGSYIYNVSGCPELYELAH
jgi:hypothetical protein